MNTKRLSRAIIFAIILFTMPSLLLAQGSRKEKMLRDSTLKFGADIEPYLKKASGGKIVKGYNYSPHINQFLKENKYVKFPAYEITIGRDAAYPTFKCHLVVNSGNRIHFPKGSILSCPPEMKTNGNMVYIGGETRDVFIDGITLHGSKFNPGYVTNPYGVGIGLFAPKNILISNATIVKNSGDGLAVRTNWGKQSEDIEINGARIIDASRVGMLVIGIINGTFRDIYIEGTGEEVKSKVQKPQTGLSFEPNDCTSKYVNCKFYNLETKNNLGPVLGTANFSNLFAKNTCGKNKIDITINNWLDTVDDPNCYGATFDVSTFNVEALAPKYDTDKISGKFVVNNPKFVRNLNNDVLDYYFIKGKDEKINGAVAYELNNLKLISRGKPFSIKNKAANARIESTVRSSQKVIIK